MSAATTAVGTAAADIATFNVAQSVLLAGALALVGGTVLLFKVALRKFGIRGGIHSV